MAAVAMGANAQYVTDDAGVAPVLEKGVKTVYAWSLDAAAMDALTAKGVNVIDQQINDETRFLYIWDNTLVGNETSASPVGADFQTNGHIALTVGTVGWSGAGMCAVGPGTDFSDLDDDTYFHLGYCAMTNPVKSLALILFAGDAGNKPAQISVGDAFVDNGTTFPPVGPAPSDEWQAVDVKFSDLKKLCPTFTVPAVADYKGNYFSFLAGGVSGQNFDFDAIYLYTTKEAGIKGVEAEGTDLVITGRTINAAGASSIVLYDLAGKTVKRANSSVMGLEGIGAGLYIAKAGNKVAKVVVK